MVLLQRGEDLSATVRQALSACGVLDRLSPSARLAIKPNLTYPYHRPGVTTSPEVIRAAVDILREVSPHIAIVETDGGYGAWSAEEAFGGHGLYEISKEFDAEVVNLSLEAREFVEFQCRGRSHQLPLPTRLLHETDLLISMPVPKIHAMTGLSLAYKNQWGCVPDLMRLRRHHILDEALVAINRSLKPAVLGDGTCFLDGNGPLDGEVVPMGLIIGATDAGSFDRYVSELMGFPWQRISHLRRAARLGDMPTSLDDIAYSTPPAEARSRVFRLRRTPRNWIALAGFKSRFLTWLGYESWFGRVVLHAMLYAVAGKPVKPQPTPPYIPARTV